MSNDLANLNIYKFKLMKVYRVSFKSMSDLHLYLSGSPEINHYVFREPSSSTGFRYFAGKSFEESLEYCLGGYGEDYEVVLKMQKELEKYVPVKQISRKHEKAVAGSHPNVPAFVAGSPKAMYRMQRAKEKKFCTIYLNLACPALTPHSAILNRGALVLSLVKLLEDNGIGVNLKVFLAAYCLDEIFLFEIMLKNPQDALNSKKCVFPMCAREFTRRLIFRVMESTPFVNKEWYPNYGEPLTDNQLRALLDLSDKDYVISSPIEMGITGGDIIEDGRNLFCNLGLDESIIVLDRFEERNSI